MNLSLRGKEMNRRSFINTGVAGSLSFAYLNAADIKKVASKAKAKSVIYLFAGGGLSHLDSFNMTDTKKEHLGKSTPIDTSITGYKVSHFFPKMAKQVDKCAIINSMQTGQGAHPPAIYKMLTSYNPRSSITHPHLGSWVSKALTKESDAIPNFINVNTGGEGSAGFFPGKYAALPILNPNEGIRFIKRHKNVNQDHFNKRMALLKSFNSDFDKEFKSRESDAYKDSYSNAIKFMNSKDVDAFDVKRESANIKKLYAKDSFSQGCMLAARLVEKGVKYIRVNSGGWDDHDAIYDNFPKRAKSIDHGMAALLEHLQQKGLLKETLLVLASEFGRGPNINKTKGRDHQPKGFTCILAGAGIQGGNIYGKITSDGKDVAENPVEVDDFNATIAYAMGLSLEHEEMSPSGRPFKVANKGKALTQLF